MAAPAWVWGGVAVDGIQVFMYPGGMRNGGVVGWVETYLRWGVRR